MTATWAPSSRPLTRPTGCRSRHGTSSGTDSLGSGLRMTAGGSWRSGNSRRRRRTLSQRWSGIFSGTTVGGNRKSHILGNPKSHSFGLSMTARRSALSAWSTERERCADAWMGDQDVVETLLGSGRLEGGAVEAVRSKSWDDPLLAQDGATGPGSVGRCKRVCTASAGDPQAGSPYKGVIDARLEAYPKLSAKRLFDEVRAAG